MAKYFIEDTALTAIADSIRAKKNTTADITPENMPSEIASIETGGGSGSGGGGNLAKIIDRTATSVTAEDLQGVTAIGDYAFYNYSTLQSIELQKSIELIGKYAFNGCSAIVSITIPDSVTSIGDYAFSSCSRLQSAVIEAGVTNLGGSVFLGCKNLMSVILPSTLTSIYSNCFRNCTSLSNVAIPVGIKTINGSVFYGCTALASVDFSHHASVPTLSNKNAFYNVPSTCKVIVPDALYDEWIAATNWSALTVTYVKASEV